MASQIIMGAIQMEFEERLKNIMIKQGLTQKELAIRSGITEASMSKYLSGERTPRIDVILNLSRALEITTDELLGEEENNIKHDFFKAKTLLARGLDNISDEDKIKLISLIAQSMENKK